MNRQGHRIGDRKVANLRYDLDYSLQAIVQTREGSQHPERNAQFENINTLAQSFENRHQSVISVDIKRKELVVRFLESRCRMAPEEPSGRGAPP